jgi:hypothetical protein
VRRFLLDSALTALSLLLTMALMLAVIVGTVCAVGTLSKYAGVLILLPQERTQPEQPAQPQGSDKQPDAGVEL